MTYLSARRLAEMAAAAEDRGMVQLAAYYEREAQRVLAERFEEMCAARPGMTSTDPAWVRSSRHVATS